MQISQPLSPSTQIRVSDSGIHVPCNVYEFPSASLPNYTPLTICTPTAGCPDTGPQVEPSPEILPGTATVTWQAAQTSDPVLTTGMLYAVYSLCGSESSSYQLVAEAIEGLSYTVTGLPAPAQCALRVVAYHRYCLQDLDGDLLDETLPFTTAIEGTYISRLSYIYMRGNEI